MDNSGTGMTPESAALVIVSVVVGVIMLTCFLVQLLKATFSHDSIGDFKKTKRKPRRRLLRQRNSDVAVALQMIRDSVQC